MRRGLLSFRYALQLLTPASILAGLAGRQQIEMDDISEMGELFLDAKTSAGIISSGGASGKPTETDAMQS